MIPADRMADRVDGGGVTPVYVAWHTARHQDLAVNGVLRGCEEVLGSWADRVGLEGDTWRGLAEGEDLDLVAVSPRWPDCHEEMVVACADAGVRGVLCEKPFARTLAEADAMIDATDRKLLNLLQSECPLVERPFDVLAGELGIGADEVIDRVQRLKDRNIVRQIGAIFDTRRLGYTTCLVAMKFADDKLDQGAHVFNEHPGVSHNYARVGDYNLWFTMAVAPGENLEETVKIWAERAGAERYRMLPTIKFFKIGLDEFHQICKVNENRCMQSSCDFNFF